MDGVSVTGGNGSNVTHDGGQYALVVAPGTITVTATYQGQSGSSGPFDIASGELVTKNITIELPVATDSPTSEPVTAISATPEPTPVPTPAPANAPSGIMGLLSSLWVSTFGTFAIGEASGAMILIFFGKFWK
jgi:hypothetical protein